MGRAPAPRKKSRHATFLYAISNVEFDDSTMSISATVEHSSERQTISIDARFLAPNHPGHELAKAVYECLKKQAENQASWETLTNLRKGSTPLIETLVAEGVRTVDDVDDRTLSRVELGAKERTLLLSLLREQSPTRARTARGFLKKADSKRTNRPDEDVITSLIEHCKQVLDGAMAAQDQVLAGLGFPTEDFKGWSVTVEGVLEAVRRRDHQRPEAKRVANASKCSKAWDDEQAIDWFLLNPAKRYGEHHGKLRPGSSVKSTLLPGLFPRIEVLSCLATMHCLVDNRGYNETTILGLKPEHFGFDPANGAGSVALAKARNRKQQIDGVLVRDRFKSVGGLLHFAVTLTRFNRHWHRQLVAQDPDANAGAAELIYAPFTPRLPVELAPQNRYVAEGHERSVGFQKLREFALYEGLKEDPGHDVAMHEPEQRDHYLRFALPLTARDALTVEAHDEMASHVNYVDSTDTADDGSVDTGLTVCENNLKDPDGSDRLCSLGPAACFACPHGYRTIAHAPMLSVALEVAVEIAEHDLERAEQLHLLARRCREQIAKFPQSARTPDITPDHATALRFVVGDLILNWKEASS